MFSFYILYIQLSEEEVTVLKRESYFGRSPPYIVNEDTPKISISSFIASAPAVILTLEIIYFEEIKLSAPNVYRVFEYLAAFTFNDREI